MSHGHLALFAPKNGKCDVYLRSQIFLKLGEVEKDRGGWQLIMAPKDMFVS